MIKQLSGNSGQLERYKITNQNEQERDALLPSNSTYTQEDNLNNAMVRTPEWKFRKAAQDFYDATAERALTYELIRKEARDELTKAVALLSATPEYKAWADAHND